MQLIHHPASPFARKARVAALELGFGETLDLVHVDLTLGKYNRTVAAHSPLGKVPVLIADDDEIIFDSYVICDYLDDIVGGHRLIPHSGAARWRVLRLHALADGIIEAGQLLRQETVVRPPDAHNAAWMALQSSRMEAGLDVAETYAGEFGDPVDLGQIALACALGWLEFRALAEPLRDNRPTLFAWYNRFARRPSMAATNPSD